MDATGLDSFEVARPLDSAAGAIADHMFIATNADYPGDPHAVIFSFGKLDNGNMGNVSSGHHPAPISASAAATDRKAWLSLIYRNSSASFSQIDASDKVVTAVANALLETKPYAILPGNDYQDIFSRNTVNSNSAAAAVADKSTSISGGSPTPNPTSKLTPGADQSNRVQFKPISLCGPGGNLPCN